MNGFCPHRTAARRIQHWVSAGALAGALVWSTVASATPDIARQVPSLPVSCNTCHADGGDSARNSFGLDVEVTLSGDAFVDWGRLYNVDSDGDGQSNGMELGDPCGQWVSGPPLRTYSHSAPGDESDASPAGEEGCTDGVTRPRNFEDRPYEVEGLINENQVQNSTILNSCGGCGGQGGQTTTTTTTTALFWFSWRRLRRRRLRKNDAAAKA